MPRWVIFLAVAIGIWYFTEDRRPWSDIIHTEGYLVEAPPLQSEADDVRAVVFKEYTITPVASLSGQALVLSRKNYSLDNEAVLSPTDLALGWGPMSNARVLDQLRISQRNRWYYWQTKGPELPVREQDIVHNSANMHMIPSDERTAAVLKKIRRGDLIQFEGYLVNIQKSDGWHWNSSTSRTDSRGGSCEVVWLKDLSIMGSE